MTRMERLKEKTEGEGDWRSDYKFSQDTNPVRVDLLERWNSS